MADDISIIFLPIEEGEGFGLGGFGGIEEPFGSIGVSNQEVFGPSIDSVGDTGVSLLTRGGAVILGSTTEGRGSTSQVLMIAGNIRIGNACAGLDTQPIVPVVRIKRVDDRRVCITGGTVDFDGEKQGATVVVGMPDRTVRYPHPT